MAANDFDDALAAMGGVDTSGLDVVTVHASLIMDLLAALALFAIVGGALLVDVQAMPQPVAECAAKQA